MRILVVDDSLPTRILLVKYLSTWGYESLTARDGAQAYDIVCREQVQMLITDWMMPEMDGLELCRKIRASSLPGYVYTIILTARDSKSELVTAMEAGADDYLSKPFDRDELKVRIRAGERILNLEKELADRNRELQTAYSTIREDLQAAARLQKRFLPPADRNVSNFRFDWIFVPSRFVAGDTFNYVRLDERFLGFFLIDVAGHGVPAAMLSFTLSRALSSGELFAAALPGTQAGGSRSTPAPSAVMALLNRRFVADDETMQYFTMICGIIDLREAAVTVSTAGHPPLIQVSADGRLRKVGSESFPLGLYPQIEFEESTFTMMPGDRLFLCSDGVTDCSGPAGEPFSQERLAARFKEARALPLHGVIQDLEYTLGDWHGSRDFEDDITVLAVERAKEAEDVH